MATQDLELLVADLMTELGWRTDDREGRIRPGQVRRAVGVLHGRGAIHGFVPVGEAGIRLTEDGQRAAVTALRTGAAGPRDWLP